MRAVPIGDLRRTLEGDAVNEEITGADVAAETVTVTLLLAVPALFVAVKV